MAYQKSQIKSVQDNKIEIYHPDLINVISKLTADVSATGTSLTVDDNSDWDNGDLFIIGTIGQPKTECKKINAAVTYGTSLTCTALTFDHPNGDTIQKVLWDRFELSGASTLTGSKTTILAGTSTDAAIRYDEGFTSYINTGTAYSYYFVRYYSTSSTTYSEYSDGISATDYTTGEVGYLISSALRSSKKSLGGNITHDWFFDEINDCLNYKGGKLKHWSGLQNFDYSLGVTTRGSYKYTLPTDIYDKNTNKSILSVRIGTGDSLIYQDKKEWEKLLEDVVHTEVRTQASAGDTTLEIDNSYDFPDSGSVDLFVSGTKYTLTYTGVTRSTTAGVLTGIPASGTGSITVTLPVDTGVWIEEEESEPNYFTVYDGSLYIYKLPDSSHDNMNVYLDYYTKVTNVDSLSDTLEFPRYDAVKHWLLWKLRALDNASGELNMNDGDFILFNDILDTMIRKELSGQKWKWTPKINTISY